MNVASEGKKTSLVENWKEIYNLYVQIFSSLRVKSFNTQLPLKNTIYCYKLMNDHEQPAKRTF